ncbi:hypothetical protein CFC21_003007 [Triticum aestivum]|uniref:FCP1 homology domain-containing protein n=1 Tax=Triticum aestivum TaxID=4565 RepID=A0A3B5Y2S6_WHEAT|nr:hypothetical protein CFC21_003007 [Triticum aestivum]
MAAATEVYSPTPAAEHRGQAAWWAVVGWLALLLQVLLRVIRGAPSSLGKLLRSLGLRHPILSAAPAVAFVQLPSKAPADDLPPLSPPPGRLTVRAHVLPRERVVLDLDETLICAYESSSLPATVRTQAVEAGLHCFDMECVSSDKDAKGRQRVNHVTVFERPGLHEFLQKTSEFADLILFTAGLEGYAKPLVDRIDAHNRFCRRLYRPSTVTTEYRDHVKDLSCLSKDFRRIVLVDNNPYSFLLQPLNGIPCLTFSAGQPMDDQLMRVIFPLLKRLSLQNDVRPALHDAFHMPEWFQRNGIPQIDQAM